MAYSSIFPEKSTRGKVLNVAGGLGGLPTPHPTYLMGHMGESFESLELLQRLTKEHIFNLTELQ